MKYFPLFLDLREKHCLVIGSGTVGKRKIATLVACNPKKLTVVDPSPQDAEMQALLGKNPDWIYCERLFSAQDLDGVSLVFICTDDPEYNARISSCCKGRNILCNSATPADDADVVLPATFSRKDLTLAISTGGKSPALARHLRLRLEKIIGEEYIPMLNLLGEIRKDLLALDLPQQENKIIFSALVRDEVIEVVSRQDKNGLDSVLRSILPQELHDKIRTFYVSLL